MAQSCTITKSTDRPVKQAIFSWVSGTGADSGQVSGGTGLTAFVISGEIVRITTDPGSPAPDANYDCVINDADGFDIAGGFLANRHTTSVESIVPRLQGTLPNGSTQYAARVMVDSTLELVISNAGTSKAGTVRVYFV